MMTQRSRFMAGMVFLVVLFGVGAVQASSNIDFSLAQAGSISGTVRAEGASPTAPGLTGLIVYAIDPADNTIVAVTSTFSIGTYQLNGLAPGSYRVYVSSGVAYDFSGGSFTQTNYAGEYYPNSYGSAGASLVNVSAGAVTENIDFALGSGGSVTGTVVGEPTATPIPFASVFAKPLGSTLPESIALSAHHMTSVQADGSYELDGLPPGNYRVYTQAPSTWADEYYNDVGGTYEKASAMPVSVSDGAPTGGIDFSLAVGGTIAGTVTRAANGQPVSGAIVDPLPVADPDLDFYFSPGYTNSNGDYTVEGLPPGDYRLHLYFSAPEHDELAREFYPGVYLLTSAMPVTTTLNSVALNIDFDAETGGAVTGTVRRADNAMPLEGVTVAAGIASDSVADELVSPYETYVLTDADGNYRIPGLPPGQYLVGAAPESNFGVTPTGPSYLRYFVGAYYDGAQVLAAADPVAVTLGTDVGGVDFALAIGAAISGTVTREGDGVPLQDISVYTAREPDLTPDYDTALDFLLFGGSAKSGPSGSYQLVGLPNDDMYVYALDEQSAYLSEAYDNQADLVGATPVPTTAGVVMTQSLSGTVLSDSDGSPVPGLLVSVYETSTTKLAGQATTQSDGSFSVDGLFPGGFRVMVDGGDAYVSEYYADATNIADAQLVQVLGTDLTGIDFGLAAVDAVGPADVLITILSILLEEP